jgi:DNA primase
MIPITKSYLRRMRNEIEMRKLMVEVLKIEHRHSGGRFRFHCPECGQFDTAVNPNTNLGRCFGCRKNFNPIDLVIQVKQYDFLQAVEFLDRFLPEQTAPGQAAPT